MNKKIFTLLVYVFLMSSCSIYHIDSIDTTDTYHPPKSPSMAVYLEQVDKPYEIIGTVTINAERKQRSVSAVIEKMKREAAILGGDAVTDLKSDATGTWKRLPAQHTIGNAYIRANYTGSVIVFK